MSAQHTPGPWHVDLYDAAGVDGVDGCRVAITGFGEDDTDQANARLIAAAPDMLAALEDAPTMSKYHGQRGFEADRFIADYEAWRVKARAAIAKAEGR
jgi:hypothetical protein